MARIFQDGFETGRPMLPGVGGNFGVWLGSLWQSNQDSASLMSRHIGVQSDIARGARYALEMYKSTTSNYRLQIFRDLEQNLADHYGRVEFYIKFADTAPGNKFSILQLRDDTYDNIVGSVCVEKEAEYMNMYLDIGGVQVAECAQAFMCDTWVRLEWRLSVDNTSGVFEVRRNGDTLLLFEGDTDPHGTGHVKYLSLGTTDSNATFVMYYDDVAVNDITGEMNNSWPGRGNIIYLPPRAAGEHAEWIPSEQSANYSKHFVKNIIYSSCESLASYPPGNAFNENSGNYWRSVGYANEWIGFELLSSAVITRLWIGGQTTSYSPENIRIEGSHDGESWDILAEEYFDNNGQFHEYDFINSTAYKFYRLYIISAHSSRLYLYDVRFYQVPAQNWATLFDAPDTGDEARVVSGTVEKKDSYLMLRLAEDLGYDPVAEIKAVQHLLKGKFEDSESRIKPFIRLGVSEDEGPVYSLMNDYLKYYQYIWDKNPFTNEAWSRAEIDDLEAGIEHSDVE